MYVKPKQFKKRLVDLGLTQIDVAKELKLSLPYTSNMINARKRVDIDRRLIMIKLLGYEPKDIRKFFTRKEPELL